MWQKKSQIKFHKVKFGQETYFICGLFTKTENMLDDNYI